MELFLIISLLLTVTVAQQPFLTCNYEFYDGVYLCNLAINNPNGLNNFTEIGGIHLEGFTNADIRRIYRRSGISTNVPSIICDTFPHLDRFYLEYTGLTEIDDGAFGSCSQATAFYLNSNNINSVSTNAFVNNPDLIYIDLHENLLSTLPENVFMNQQNLEILILNYNPFGDFPIGLFRPLVSIQGVYLGDCNLTAINNQSFRTNTNMGYLYAGGNRIAVSP